MQQDHTRSRRRRPHDRRYALKKYLACLYQSREIRPLLETIFTLWALFSISLTDWLAAISKLRPQRKYLPLSRSYLAGLVLLLTLVSCSDSPSLTSYSGVKMTVPFHILIGGNVDAEPAIEKTFEDINNIFNNWNPGSEVSQLNRLKAGQKVAISPEMATFLKQVDRLVQQTDGLFDPTVGALTALWGTCTKEPTEEELSALAIGWDKIHMEDGLFWKDHDELALDFGGIAKGYCVDLLIERLNYKNVFVSWGGDIRTKGQHPTGRPWRVAVRFSDQCIDLYGAIATSGHYEQQRKIGNKVYTHICNPLTLRALEVKEDSPPSTTIQASTCLEADGLATAALIKILQ